MPGDGDRDGDRDASSALALFGVELRRLRIRAQLSQKTLASQVLHSRQLIALVELGERWPSLDLARRADTVLDSDGILARLWPLVERERVAARATVSGDQLADLRAVVLRLAALTGADLTTVTARTDG